MVGSWYVYLDEEIHFLESQWDSAEIVQETLLHHLDAEESMQKPHLSLGKRSVYG